MLVRVVDENSELNEMWYYCVIDDVFRFFRVDWYFYLLLFGVFF